MGVDDNLMDNLETYFCLDYPKNKFEILFCVQDTTDPVITVVNSLIEKYPNIDAKLFSGGKHVGINPKINNMIQGYDKAKYELLLISDAGIKSKQFLISYFIYPFQSTLFRGNFKEYRGKLVM